MVEKKEKFDIYAKITDHIISQLETGNIPWKKPWNAGMNLPVNGNTGKVYRGINLLMTFGRYSNPNWLTFKQISEAGGHVKKDEKGTPIIYMNSNDKKVMKLNTKTGVEEEKVEKHWFERLYWVFNVEQTDGLPEEKYGIKTDGPKIKTCDELLAAMNDKPTIIADIKCAYNNALDVVKMPHSSTFDAPEHYYASLYHEIIHWTGNEKRLDREGVKHPQFGDEKYSFEELIAELGAAFVCAETGISNVVIDNQTSYIKGWLTILKEDKKIIVKAARAARDAVDYIHNEKVVKIAAETMSSPA